MNNKSAKTTFEDVSTFIDGELHDRVKTEGIGSARDPETAAILAGMSRVDGLVRAYYGSQADQAIPEHLAAVVHDGFAARRRGKSRNAFWMPMAASFVIATASLGGAFHFAQTRTQQQIAAYEERWAEGQRALQTALQDALETKESGAVVVFAAGEADIHGTIRPTRTYKSRSGHWCREFSEVIEIDGTRELRQGLACRENSGVWARLETKISGNPAIRVIR
jgi:surface antigen